MMMTFGKYKGRPVGGIPRSYLEWVKDKVEGPLQLAVYSALRLPAPPQPRAETVDEMQDRVVREVFLRFREREQSGGDQSGGEAAEV